MPTPGVVWFDLRIVEQQGGTFQFAFGQLVSNVQDIGSNNLG
jgi:hypothetical protein